MPYNAIHHRSSYREEIPCLRHYNIEPSLKEFKLKPLLQHTSSPSPSCNFLQSYYNNNTQRWLNNSNNLPCRAGESEPSSRWTISSSSTSTICMQTVSIVGERRKSIESTFALTRSILLRKEPISHSALVFASHLMPDYGCRGWKGQQWGVFISFRIVPVSTTLCALFSPIPLSRSLAHTHPLSALYRAAQQWLLISRKKMCKKTFPTWHCTGNRKPAKWGSTHTHTLNRSDRVASFRSAPVLPSHRTTLRIERKSKTTAPQPPDRAKVPKPSR